MTPTRRAVADQLLQPTRDEHMTQFDRTTHVHPVQTTDDRAITSSTFQGYLDPSWASLLAVHGGYVASLAVRAAQTMLPDRDVRTVSTTFLRPARVGPVELTLDVLRSGRSFSTLTAHIRQAGQDIAETRVTLLKPPGAGTTWSTKIAQRPAPWQQCVPFQPPPAIAHFDQAQFRIDPATIPTGDAADSRIAGHLRPIETRPIDAAWLVVMGDWFPPTPFRRLTFPTGGISIDYSIHIHRTLPADHNLWLEGVFISDNNTAGIALERGTLAGIPIAETFHTRWTG